MSGEKKKKKKSLGMHFTAGKKDEYLLTAVSGIARKASLYILIIHPAFIRGIPFNCRFNWG